MTYESPFRIKSDKMTLKKLRSRHIYKIFIYVCTVAHWLRTWLRSHKLDLEIRYLRFKSVFHLWNVQGDPGDLPIGIKLWMSNSLLKTKQQIILTKCCANNSFQTIKHCNWQIETHYFHAPINFLREFFTKIHFRSVKK